MNVFFNRKKRQVDDTNGWDRLDIELHHGEGVRRTTHRRNNLDQKSTAPKSCQRKKLYSAPNILHIIAVTIINLSCYRIFYGLPTKVKQS